MIDLGTTTGFSTIEEDLDILITREERWPLIGDLASPVTVEKILKSLAGLRKYWDCIAKAKLACTALIESSIQSDKNLGFPIVVFGQCFVWSGDWQSSYGYAWNPPYELHSWVEFSQAKGILDVALPGVIEKGLITRDAVGFYLINREPVILNGVPPTWIEYKREVI